MVAEPVRWASDSSAALGDLECKAEALIAFAVFVLLLCMIALWFNFTGVTANPGIRSVRDTEGVAEERAISYPFARGDLSKPTNLGLLE
jgi:hypothetical protein